MAKRFCTYGDCYDIEDLMDDYEYEELLDNKDLQYKDYYSSEDYEEKDIYYEFFGKFDDEKIDFQKMRDNAGILNCDVILENNTIVFPEHIYGYLKSKGDDLILYISNNAVLISWEKTDDSMLNSLRDQFIKTERIKPIKKIRLTNKQLEQMDWQNGDTILIYTGTYEVSFLKQE